MIFYRIKRFFKRKKQKHLTKLHYTDEKMCSVDLSCMVNVYHILNNDVYDYISAFAINMVTFDKQQRSEEETLSSINYFYDKYVNAQKKLKEALREWSHTYRLYLFFMNKGYIEKSCVKEYKLILDEYTYRSKDVLNYNPYLEFKQIKIKIRKNEMLSDFKM